MALIFSTKASKIEKCRGLLAIFACSQAVKYRANNPSGVGPYNPVRSVDTEREFISRSPKTHTPSSWPSTHVTTAFCRIIGALEQRELGLAFAEGYPSHPLKGSVQPSHRGNA